MNNKNIARSILLLSICLTKTSYAMENMIAIGPRLGTGGLGIEGKLKITDNLFGRISANYLRYIIHKVRDSKLNFKGKFALFNVPLMLDYHPFKSSGLRMSLGVSYNTNKANAVAKSNKSITIYGKTYTPDELRQVNAKLALLNRIAPVVSIGYDNSLISNNTFTFGTELGIIYGGRHKVKVSSIGLAANDQHKLGNLKSHVNKRLRKIKKYLKFYPIIAVSLKYNF